MGFVYWVGLLSMWGGGEAFAQSPEEVRADLDEFYSRSLESGDSHPRAVKHALNQYQARARSTLELSKPENPATAQGHELFKNQFATPFFENGCTAEGLHDELSRGALSFAQRQRLYLATANSSESERNRLLWVAQTWMEDIGTSRENPEKSLRAFDEFSTPLRKKLGMRSRFQLYRELALSPSARKEWVPLLANHVVRLEHEQSDSFLAWLGSDEVKGGEFKDVVAPLRQQVAAKAKARVDARRAEGEALKAGAIEGRHQIIADAFTRGLEALKKLYADGLAQGLGPQKAADRAKQLRLAEGVLPGDWEAENLVVVEFDRFIMADVAAACSVKVAKKASGVLGRLKRLVGN